MMRAEARVLLIGMGGIGCPAALVLAQAGVGHVGLCDDDAVERTNLHRQILFSDADVGTPKIDAALRALERSGDVAYRAHRSRILPDNAVATVSQYDVVLEGSDNFATKFLAADACAIARVPVVHASAVRWIGTALAVGPAGGPCYRCLFEDVPAGDTPNCSEAGVMGPVVGVIAAAAADLALAIADGEAPFGELVTFDGRSGNLRRRSVARRADCPLCGYAPRIRGIESSAYVSPACAG
ncbi:MAG TPA: HesA/MoeB/ThiF family protein [Polyangiaceae bacterium]|nr:HesA/MoeB/ThiF family protein [Polyangiaceae bacterium]